MSAAGGERKVVIRWRKGPGKCNGAFLRWPLVGRSLSRVSENEFDPTLAVADKFSNQANKSRQVVVLKHTFTLEGLEGDLSLLSDLKEDVRGGVFNSRQCHERCVVRCKWAPYFSYPG
jgi:hypothetical protein